MLRGVPQRLGYSTGEDERKKRTRGDNDDAGNDGGGNSKRTRAAATAAAAGAGGGAGDERNKRFGALLFGHIKKAKTTLERDATLIEKRKTVENKLAAEQEKLASTLHQMERKMAEDERSERAKHAVQVRLDALKRRQVDVQAAGQVHKATLLPLAAVLLTETQPQLSWLPASHNAATQALLDARVEKIGAEISRREEDDGRLVDDLEEDIRALQQTLHGDDGDGDGDENGHDAEAGKDGVTLSEYKARMQKRREEREEALKNVDLRETLRGGRDFAWGGQGFNDGGRGGGVGGGGGGGHRGYDNRGDRGGFAPHRGPDLRDLREPPRRRGDHDELGRDRRPPAPRRRDREAVHNEVEVEVDRRPFLSEDDEDGDFDRRPLQNADNEEDGEGGRRPPQDDAPAHDVEEEEDEDEDEVIVYFT